MDRVHMLFKPFMPNNRIHIHALEMKRYFNLNVNSISDFFFFPHMYCEKIIYCNLI